MTKREILWAIYQTKLHIKTMPYGEEKERAISNYKYTTNKILKTKK